MLKAHKIFETILSEVPLYASATNPNQSLLFSGGGGTDLFQVDYSKISSLTASRRLENKDSVTLTEPDFDLERIQGIPSSLYSISFNSDHSSLWMGGGKGILTWLEVNQKPLGSSFLLGPSPIYCIQPIPNTNQLIIGLGNGELKILNVQLIQEISSFPDQDLREIKNNIQSLQISEEAVRVMVFHPSKPLLAISGKDCQIRIVDSRTFEILAILSDHRLPVFSLAYSPDGNFLISGSRDASLKVWDAYSFQLLQTIPAHLFAINHILFHPLEPYFLTASMDKSIKIWGADDFRLYKILNAEKSGGHTLSVNRLAWLDSQGNFFSSISDDRRLILWDFR